MAKKSLHHAMGRALGTRGSADHRDRFGAREEIAQVGVGWIALAHSPRRRRVTVAPQVGQTCPSSPSAGLNAFKVSPDVVKGDLQLGHTSSPETTFLRASWS
jgi:hypothetical protein